MKTKSKIIFLSIIVTMICCNFQTTKAQLVINENTHVKATSGTYLNAQGNWINNNELLDLGEGTIKFSGTEAQSIEGTNTFNNMLVDKNLNELNLNGNLICKDALYIAAGNFNVMPEKQLTLNGNFLNTGNFTIKSDINGTGSLLDNGTINGSGSFTVEQFLTGGVAVQDIWHYVTPQAENVFSTVFNTASLLFYNETINSFIPILSPNIPLNIMQGYAASFEGNNTVYYSGNLLTGIQSISGLTYTNNSTANYDGYNLVGNPYPSTINIESNGVSLNNLGNAFYFWDNSLNEGFGDFAVYVRGGSGINGATQYIAPGQGFFLKVDSPGNTGIFSMGNSARTHYAQPFYRDPEVNSLRLIAEGVVFSDETIICFNENATNVFDSEFDAYKFLINDNINHLYSKTSDDFGLAINTFPEALLSSSIDVTLNYEVVESGAYTISAYQLESFTDIPISLEDIQTGIITDFYENPVYIFTANTGDDPARFIVHFNTSTSPTQQYSFSLGYKIVSSYIIPESPNMLDVMANNLNSNLDFIRNTSGYMLRKIGPIWVNSIGDWVTTEGYLFKMNGPDNLSITGEVIDPQTPIGLLLGYQIISFLPENPVNTADAFAEVLDNLEFVRNTAGYMFRKIGPVWVNGIGDMQSGEGYLVKMTGEDQLIYPEATKQLLANIKAKPEHFIITNANPVDSVWTIYFEAGVLEAGDEIAVFDGENLSGAGIIISDNTLENPIPVFSNLYKSGSEPTIKVWIKNENREYLITDYSFTNPYGDAYTAKVFPEKDGEYSLLNFSTSGISDENKRPSFTIYPNPSEGIFNISFEGISGDVKMKVVDIHGNDYCFFEIEGIRNLLTKQFDLKELAPGVYFIQLSGRNFNQVKKIVIQ